jgi:large subunit ribosomal protein L19e
MKLPRIRLIASKLLKVSQDRVYFNPEPENLEKIKEAMTRQDIKDRIAQGLISKIERPGQSKTRAQARRIAKKKGRHKGAGKKRGTYKARAGKKSRWMKNVRAQRKQLKELRKKKMLEQNKYRDIYKKIKGGFFRGKKHLLDYAGIKFEKLQEKKETRK